MSLQRLGPRYTQLKSSNSKTSLRHIEAASGNVGASIPVNLVTLLEGSPLVEGFGRWAQSPGATVSVQCRRLQGRRVSVVLTAVSCAT